MTDELTLARNVISRAEIASVRLIAANTKATIRTPQPAGPAPVRLKQEAKAIRTDTGFRVTGDFGVAILTDDVDAQPAILIEATFEIDYTLPSELVVSEEELNAFARVNGLFNAWPYFREFVQNTMSRMQLPPLVLPLYRIPRRTAAVTAGTAKETLAPGTETQPASPTPAPSGLGGKRE